MQQSWRSSRSSRERLQRFGLGSDGIQPVDFNRPHASLGQRNERKQIAKEPYYVPFMVLIHQEEADFSKYSPNDFQNLMQQFQTWTQKITKEGYFVAGDKLTKDPGKTIKVKNGRVIVDGPYADSKDAIGGYYVIKAESMDEALEVVKGCPAMTYGGILEVREVDQL